MATRTFTLDLDTAHDAETLAAALDAGAARIIARDTPFACKLLEGSAAAWRISAEYHADAGRLGQYERSARAAHRAADLGRRLGGR